MVEVFFRNFVVYDGKSMNVRYVVKFGVDFIYEWKCIEILFILVCRFYNCDICIIVEIRCFN